MDSFPWLVVRPASMVSMASPPSMQPPSTVARRSLLGDLLQLLE
ncbi:MAG: hypothetical protein OXU71_11360 [Gammaproteobacteria bacterium]|nr:hypothetical protein [Gammaproteobacteria bacterium]